MHYVYFFEVFFWIFPTFPHLFFVIANGWALNEMLPKDFFALSLDKDKFIFLPFKTKKTTSKGGFLQYLKSYLCDLRIRIYSSTKSSAVPEPKRVASVSYPPYSSHASREGIYAWSPSALVIIKVVLKGEPSLI